MVIRARKAKRQPQLSEAQVKEGTAPLSDVGLFPKEEPTRPAFLSHAATGNDAKPKFYAAKRSLKTTSALKESDNRFTPPDLIHAIEESFGRISLDPCWHPKSFVKPLRHFDIRWGEDGMVRDWAGAVVFVNPPWSDAKKWLERCHDQWSKGQAGVVICLVPAKTDTEFFHTILATDADVYFLKGRTRFHKKEGRAEGSAQSTMIVFFGATAEQIGRFAARIAGSWWLPNRTRFASPAAVSFGPHRLFHDYEKVCCTSQGSAGSVFCGPALSWSADRTSPAA